jgi:hypothetical protein
MAPPTLPPPITPGPPLTKEEWIAELSSHFESDPNASDFWEYTCGVLIKNGELKEKPSGSGKYSLDVSLEFEHVMEVYFKGNDEEVEVIFERCASIFPYLPDSDYDSSTAPPPEPEALLPDERAAPLTKDDWMKKIRERFFEPGPAFPSAVSNHIFNNLIRLEFLEEAGYHDYRREKTYKLMAPLEKWIVMLLFWTVRGDQSLAEGLKLK